MIDIVGDSTCLEVSPISNKFSSLFTLIPLSFYLPYNSKKKICKKCDGPTNPLLLQNKHFLNFNDIFTCLHYSFSPSRLPLKLSTKSFPFARMAALINTLAAIKLSSNNGITHYRTRTFISPSSISLTSKLVFFHFIYFSF